MVGDGGKQAGLIPTPNMALGKTLLRSVLLTVESLPSRHALTWPAGAPQTPITSLPLYHLQSPFHLPKIDTDVL